MSDIVVGLLVAAFIFTGGVGSLLLYTLLPGHHLTSETRDAVRVGIGMVSIVASLVLGLLIASAKGTLDRADQQVRSYAADLILLDQTLRDYGADADPVRGMLLQYTENVLRTTWPDKTPTEVEPLESKEFGALLDQTLRAILALAPTNEGQRWLRNQALGVAANLIHTRWLVLIGQEGAISPVLLGIMVAWIFIIFVSFGLNAPRNGTVVTAFLLCALSIGAAIFLILEMFAPFSGFITVSAAPMQNAFAHLSQ
jgi:hypothetical protein